MSKSMGGELEITTGNWEVDAAPAAFTAPEESPEELAQEQAIVAADDAVVAAAVGGDNEGVYSMLLPLNSTIP